MEQRLRCAVNVLLHFICTAKAYIKERYGEVDMAAMRGRLHAVGKSVSYLLAGDTRHDVDCDGRSAFNLLKKVLFSLVFLECTSALWQAPC